MLTDVAPATGPARSFRPYSDARSRASNHRPVAPYPVVQHHLETFLAAAAHEDPFGDSVPAGLRLGALLDAAGDVDGASAAYEAVVVSEPLHETAHRGLLLTLTRAGRRAHALRYYIRLTALLQDLELGPEEETVELYERIRSADIVPGSSDVAVPGG